MVNFCPQKADPHCIRITAGGNLIKYPCELSTRTPDLTTSKLMWNSVLITEGAKYMCLNIKYFYLTAPLDRFKYMKMPLVLFPDWIKKKIGQIRIQRICLPGDATRHLGSPVGRHPGKQITTATFSPAQII